MASLNKPGILALLRNRLRLNDVTVSMSVLVVVLRDLSAWFLIFDTAQLTDLGSNFTAVYLFWYMYESVNANFDDMGCTWNAVHAICMISSTSRGKP